MDAFALNLRYALRSLTTRPGFTVVSLLALTLGIGANVAIFSVVNAVLLRPLPFPDPERLVSVWEAQPSVANATLSAPDFRDWKEESRSFEALAAFSPSSLNVTLGAEPERVDGVYVSAEFFKVLGVRAQVGRLIGAEDEGQRVAVLSDRFWRERRSADPAVLGSTMNLSGEVYEVIGVLPRGDESPGNALIWASSPHGLPTLRGDPAILSNRGSHYLIGMGRLKEGVTPESARRELEGIAARIADAVPSNQGHVPQVEQVQSRLVRNVRPTLMLLLGAVGLVLLIACANVANLLLARATTRKRELAIRTALGATRRQLIVQLLIESVVLSVMGGALGLLFAYWSVDGLVASAKGTLPRAQEIGVDLPVIAFAAGLSVLTGVIFGLAPAVLSSEGGEAEVLRASSRGASGGKARLRTVLVAAEIAIALVLLVGAGLLLRSFANLVDVSPGFNPSGLLTFRLSAGRPGGTAQPTNPFFTEVQARLAAIPGVRSAAAASTLPMSGQNMNGDFYIEGRERPSDGDRWIAEMVIVTSGFFETMEMPLVAGRVFDSRDQEKSIPVVVVNQTLAQKYFGGDAVGKRISTNSDGTDAMEIVGVVGDVRQRDLATEPLSELYFPLSQNPYPGVFFVVRAEGEPLELLPRVRREIASLSTSEPVFNARTMDDILTASFATRRLTLGLIVGFAAVALVLALVGIYGVVSYSVAQRTREIGIRMALGAGRAGVLKMVVLQSMMPALMGLAVGLAGAAIASRLLSGLVFGVNPLDVPTFAAVATLLGLAALLASYLPARRATRVDPQVALRAE